MCTWSTQSRSCGSTNLRDMPTSTSRANPSRGWYGCFGLPPQLARHLRLPQDQEWGLERVWEKSRQAVSSVCLEFGTMHSYEFVSTFAGLLQPIVVPPRRSLTKSQLDTRQALTALISRRTLVRFAKVSSEFNFDPRLQTIVKISEGFEIDLFCGDVCFRSVREFLTLAREGVGCDAARIGESSNRKRQHVGYSIYCPGIQLKMTCALASGLDRPLRFVLPPGLVRAPTQRSFNGPEQLRVQGRTLKRASIAAASPGPMH